MVFADIRQMNPNLTENLAQNWTSGKFRRGPVGRGASPARSRRAKWPAWVDFRRTFHRQDKRLPWISRERV